MENLHEKRKIYDKSSLLEKDAHPDALKQFQKWFSEADACEEIAEANAMSLSTVEADGCPRTRIVLLKSYGEEGFVFFTNYQSRKGASIEAHHKACLSFFWPALERQVIIKADVEKIPKNDSDEYFLERPRGSRLGALASSQSTVIPNADFLSEKLSALEDEFENKEIPRPENWGGYIAKPYEIEFWQGRPNRLHDRLLYTLHNGGWRIVRLAP